jgi:hypothetical protein
MGPEAYVVAGACSGMLASGLTTPMDVVKTKVTGDLRGVVERIFASDRTNTPHTAGYWGSQSRLKSLAVLEEDRGDGGPRWDVHGGARTARVVRDVQRRRFQRFRVGQGGDGPVRGAASQIGALMWPVASD